MNDRQFEGFANLLFAEMNARMEPYRENSRKALSALLAYKDGLEQLGSEEDTIYLAQPDQVTKIKDLAADLSTAREIECTMYKHLHRERHRILDTAKMEDAGITQMRDLLKEFRYSV